MQKMKFIDDEKGIEYDANECRAAILEIDEETYYNTIFRNNIFCARPERVLWANEVAGLARHVAQLFSMDIEIRERTDHLYIELNFDEMPIMGELKRRFLALLGIVDEVSFFCPKNGPHLFRLTLIYDTYDHFHIKHKDHINSQE